MRQPTSSNESTDGAGRCGPTEPVAATRSRASSIGWTPSPTEPVGARRRSVDDDRRLRDEGSGRRDEHQAVVTLEVVEVLPVHCDQRQVVRQCAGGDPGVVRRTGRPRARARAVRRAHSVATFRVYRTTGVASSQASRSWRRLAPHDRASAHSSSSATLTKVSTSVDPTRCPAIVGGTVPRWRREATSVSMMTSATRVSGCRRRGGRGRRR